MREKILASFTIAFRSWRRSFKAKLPYVRRRQYRILQRRHDALIASLNDLRPATEARVLTVKHCPPALSGELCLFVTFASAPVLKAHAAAHIQALVRAGIQVVVIANTDLPLERFSCDEALLRQLSGLYVRENAGFDFAAWAHGLVLCGGPQGLTRLYLTNDSIVGPLNEDAFETLLGRIRASPADIIGLTKNPTPAPHLQSYFLVFSGKALESAVLQRYFAHVLSLPTKDQVIDVYELCLTERLRKAGLSIEALFPAMSSDPHRANDVFFHWRALLHAGFPYVKTRVLIEFGNDAELRALVSPAFHESAR